MPLPAGVREPFTVYVNGVRQEFGRDYHVVRGPAGLSQRARPRGQTWLLAMVPGRMGYRDLQTERSGRCRVGRRRLPTYRSRTGHRAHSTKNRPVRPRSWLRRKPPKPHLNGPLRQARHPCSRRTPAYRSPAGARWDGRAHPHAGQRPARHHDRPGRGDRVRRGVLGEPAALRQQRRQRPPDPRPHDPPGRDPARPPRAGADRAGGRDLPLPVELPGRRVAEPRPAARARRDRRRLRRHDRRPARRPHRHRPPRRPAARRRQAADAGRVRHPGDGGHRVRGALRLPARRARAQGPRARPRRRGRAARRPVASPTTT